MAKKDFKKQIEKLLRSEEREILTISISIGDGGVKGGMSIDRDIDKLFKDCFGKPYQTMLKKLKEEADEFTKKAGKQLTKMIIEKGLEGKMVEPENKKELIEVLARLGELLGREVKPENIDFVRVEDCNDDDEEDEDCEDDDEE